MEFTIYISEKVIWFVAGIIASIVWKYLYKKVLVPGYIYLVEKIDMMRSENCQYVARAAIDISNSVKSFKEKTIYDPYEGHHLPLTRALKSEEMVELSKRKNDGEPIKNILESMNVLKE